MRILALSAFILILLSGCAGPKPKPEGLAFSGADQASADKTLVYFYRLPNEARNCSMHDFPIYMDGQKIGVLAHGGYFKTTIDAGTHRIVADYRGIITPVESGQNRGPIFVPQLAR